MPRSQYAANFYADASEARIEEYLKGFEPPSLSGRPIAGLVPHAGWDYSGPTAAKVFRTIKATREPKTFILLGTVHRGIRADAVYPKGSWATPFGDVVINEELAGQLHGIAAELLQQSDSAHDYEHSIEVQMPFLKYFFPQATAVPILVLPDEDAAALGGRIGEFLKERREDVAILGTTDLTHYGDMYMFTPSGLGPQAHKWMKNNDARIIELASSLKAEEIVSEARENQNACGAGALAATVAAARAMGCHEGLTIEYTTSYDVKPERDFRMAVGYVGMVFCGT